MPLLQTPIVPLCEARTELLLWVVEVMAQAEGGEFKAAEEPLEAVGRRPVLGVWVGGLVVREEGFEGVGGGGVGSEVGADFLGFQGEMMWTKGDVVGESVRGRSGGEAGEE